MSKLYRYGFWLLSALVLVEIFAFVFIETELCSVDVPNELRLIAKKQSPVQGLETKAQAANSHPPAPPIPQHQSWAENIQAYQNLKTTKGVWFQFGAFANEGIDLSPEMVALLDIDGPEKRALRKLLLNTRNKSLQLLKERTSVKVLEDGSIYAEFEPPPQRENALNDEFRQNVDSILGPERMKFLMDTMANFNQVPHPLLNFAAKKKTWKLQRAAPTVGPGKLTLEVKTSNSANSPFQTVTTFQLKEENGDEIDTFLSILPTDIKRAIEELGTDIPSN